MERRIDVRQLVTVLTLFLIAQFAGLLLTFVTFPPTVAVAASQAAQVQQQAPSAASYIWIIVAEVIIIALVLMFVIRSYKGRSFFTLVEAYIILLGSFFFFFLIIGNILTTINSIALVAISVACAIGVYLAKRSPRFDNQSFRNLVTIISSIGAGVFIGISIGLQFGVLVLYAVLAIFAVYDYLAVFVLKFMIPLAKQAATMNLAFMIGSSELELHPKGSSKARAYTAEELKSIRNQRLRGLIKQGSVPAVSSVMLGNGDIMLPMAVAAGAYVYTTSISLGITIVLGAAVGLIATFWVLRRYRFGLPAIPPIFAFVSIALVIFSLVTGAYGSLLIVIFAFGAILSVTAMYLAIRRASVVQSASPERVSGRKSRGR